jgi:parallel beta-helix repeat protein
MSPVVARGATYYVGKSGGDFFSCAQAQSASTPKLTIDAGLRCLAAGDRLVIKQGIYVESIDPKQIPNGISREHPTRIEAEIRGKVTLFPSTGGAVGDVIWLAGQRYIVLGGLIIDAKHVKVQGIRINNRGNVETSHIRLVNVEVKNAPRNNCIGAKGSFIEILDSRIHDCGSTKLHHGVYLQGRNHLVAGSAIYNNYGHGIHIYDRTGTSDYVVIRGNHIYNNGSVGILIGSGRNNRAYNNVIENNGRLSAEGGIAIGYYGAENNHVYNNTISGNAGWCVRILRSSVNSNVYDNTCQENGRDSVTDGGTASVVQSNSATDPSSKGSLRDGAVHLE